METSQDILSPLRPLRLPTSTVLVLIILTMACALLFGLLYQGANRLASPPWFAVACLHTFLSAGFLVWAALRNEAKLLLKVNVARLLYAPSGIILVLSVLAGFFTVTLGGSVRTMPDWSTQLAFILWIPIVEEVVFRGAISRGMQRYAPGIWGMWFSALLFAWVHTMPTMSNLFSGIPLGPFLLGLICEYLRRAGSSLIPAIIFHMVCNSTVVIFSMTDGRWLDWLGWLYS